MDAWREGRARNTGRVFYFNVQTRLTSWQRPPGFPPPMPMGWTEHRTPHGQPFFYNSSTDRSTFVRPIMDRASDAAKLLGKERVQGTTWLMVHTALGRPFFYNIGTKQSQWWRPDEVAEALAAGGTSGDSSGKRRRVDCAVDAEGGGYDSAEEEARMLAEEMAMSIDPEEAELQRRMQADSERQLEAKREQLALLKAHEYGLPVASRAVKQLVEEELKRSQFEPLPYVDPDLREAPYEQRHAQFMAMLEQANISAFAAWDSTAPELEKDPV